MTIRVKFGPEILLGAPRKSPGYPSPDGKKFVYTESVYSFDSHSKSSQVVVYDFASGEPTVISKDAKASQPRWLQANLLVWLREGENGNTSFVVVDIHSPGKTYTAGTVAGPVSNLKLYHIEDGVVAVAVSGKANPDGSLHSPKDTSKSYSTAKLYDATFVRHWDAYVSSERNSIFTAILKRAPARVQGREGRYSLTAFTNALKGTGLESPIPPFGGTDHFDIGRYGLVFVAKDPDLNPATHTKCNAYWIHREDLMEFAEPKPIKFEIPSLQGAATSPTIAPNGGITFLQMQKDGYESDKNQLVHVFFRKPDARHEDSSYDITIISPAPSELAHAENPNAHVFWELSPSSLVWSHESNVLFAQAEYHGAGCLWAIPMFQKGPGSEVRQLTQKGFILEALPIPKTPYLLMSSNSLIDNSIYTVLNPYKAIATSSPLLSLDTSVHYQSERTLCHKASFMHNQFGLNPSQVDSIWWKGDNDHPVHALVMYPSTFDPSKKYPLAYLVHGGPQGAWNDQWSTRWNPALFAEQGYVVVAPNPTGSTGYGQPFTDAIKENWGGSPYADLVKGIEHIESNLKYIDTDNMVALGASYGGYMMNWIAGHPLAEKFKALVCHDGVFSMTAQLASEEQYFPMHDMGGPIWEKQEIYDKWDPARFTKHWQTPMLIIHNELDYRLTIAEGLAAFNVLQGRGIESRFLTFSDEGHWVLREENAMIWCLVVLNWCNKFVGLPEVRDRFGRNGDEFCRQGRRKVPSDK